MSSRTALITGIAGFCGSHLAELLLDKGFEVAGLDRPGINYQNLKSVSPRIDLRYVDLLDGDQLHAVIQEVKPDQIYHLAALTSKRASGTGWEFYQVNVQGTINLLEAVKESGLSPVIHIAGSSAEYGLVAAEHMPVDESCPLRPVSPYGVSKAAQGLVGNQYFVAYGLRVVRTRAFNVTGPREGDNLVGGAIAQQIALAEVGRIEPVIKVGSLAPQRDFADVRDVVRGYSLAAEQGVPGEVYNVCTGRARSARNILDTLLGLARITLRVEQLEKSIRPTDVPVQVGSFARLHHQTGWQPEISLGKTLEDLLNHWRERVLED